MVNAKRLLVVTWSAFGLFLLPTSAGAQPALRAGIDPAPAAASLSLAPIEVLPAPDSLELLEDVVFRYELVHFPYDSPALTPATRRILARKAAHLKAHPGVGVIVEGHCDARGTGAYNLELGRLRAESVRLFLRGQGVEDHRIRIVSRGKDRPLAPPAGEDAHAANRRAETIQSQD
jgi:outer membrane protein OmpA-like peptidoglycan-associated protein